MKQVKFAGMKPSLSPSVLAPVVAIYTHTYLLATMTA